MRHFIRVKNISQLMGRRYLLEDEGLVNHKTSSRDPVTLPPVRPICLNLFILFLSLLNIRDNDVNSPVSISFRAKTHASGGPASDHEKTRVYIISSSSSLRAAGETQAVS